jgi:early secretory antigenic target protein ESAT-6
MTGEIRVQFESLQAGQAGISKTYSALVGTLEELETKLKPMVTTWTGAAQESYITCKTQWDQAAANLAQVLNNIGSAIGQAHDNYQAAEQSARSNWT